MAIYRTTHGQYEKLGEFVKPRKPKMNTGTSVPKPKFAVGAQVHTGNGEIATIKKSKYETYRGGGGQHVHFLHYPGDEKKSAINQKGGWTAEYMLAPKGKKKILRIPKPKVDPNSDAYWDDLFKKHGRK